VKTTVKARNLELSDRLRSDIARKLRRLDRVAHPEASATVELTANASRAADGSHVAEVTLQNSGTVIRSTASGPNPVAALDRLLDKLERQVIRSKEKPRDSRLRDSSEAEEILAREGAGTLEPLPPVQPRRANNGTQAAALPAEAEDGEVASRIVKIKRFDMEPMFEDDAIARMEELGHQFFVFVNAENDAVNVLYRRRDGSYGVIEPIVRR
jgi:putative sigma-54 modulation protein